MATIRKRNGRFNVEIRKRGVRTIYETFDLKSNAQSFINKVESGIQQRKYKDISEEAAGTVRLVNLYLHYALCIYKLLLI